MPISTSNKFPKAALLNLGSGCLVVLLGLGFTACQSQTNGAIDAATRNRKPLPALAAAPTFELGLSVEQAYASIPHRRTVADLNRSTLSSPDKEYLTLAFHEIDQAILLRVTSFERFSRAGTETARLLAKMDQVIEFLRGIDPPASLTDYHKRVLEALSDQRAYFQEWQVQGRGFAYGESSRISMHPRVRTASSALRAAYQILMQTYAGENQHNKEAFFDYHCALDFI
jgi:hypothetical protein